MTLTLAGLVLFFTLVILAYLLVYHPWIVIIVTIVLFCIVYIGDYHD